MVEFTLERVAIYGRKCCQTYKIPLDQIPSSDFSIYLSIFEGQGKLNDCTGRSGIRAQSVNILCLRPDFFHTTNHRTDRSRKIEVIILRKIESFHGIPPCFIGK